MAVLGWLNVFNAEFAKHEECRPGEMKRREVSWTLRKKLAQKR